MVTERVKVSCREAQDRGSNGDRRVKGSRCLRALLSTGCFAVERALGNDSELLPRSAPTGN